MGQRPFDMTEWAKGRLTWMNGPKAVWHEWMGRRPFCHEWKPGWAKGQNVWNYRYLTCISYSYIYFAVKQKYELGPRPFGPCCSTYCYVTVIFDIIHWAIAHAHSCICRWAKGSPNPAPVKSARNNRSFGRVSLVPRAWDHPCPFTMNLCFVLLARTQCMSVHSLL